jgi:hypothetical protein
MSRNKQVDFTLLLVAISEHNSTSISHAKKKNCKINKLPHTV